MNEAELVLPLDAALAPSRSSGRSLVAAANAAFRAAETLRKDRILEDPWAHCFGERDLRLRAIRGARYLWPKLRRSLDELQTAHCVRHKTIDRLLLQAIEDGYRRVVVIGAGYDMRRSRFHDVLSDVQWIEVDHPATMSMKWSLLENAPNVSRDLRRVPLDLERGSLGEAIEAQKTPTVFVLEGLIHYLSRARLLALLADIAKIAVKRRVILSFIRSEMYAAADSLFIKLVRALREVPELHFSAPELAALLSGAGLGDFRSWTGRQQIEAFVPHAAARPIRLSQDVATAEGDR